MTTKTDFEESFELSDYFSMLKHNWILAIIVFVIILGAAIAYTLTTPEVYQARSLVMLTTQDQTSYLLDQPAEKANLQTQKAIILSMSVMNAVYATEDMSVPLTVNAEPIKDSNVIEIIVESPNTLTATRIANKIAESYVNFSIESRKQSAVEVSSFISEQLKSYKTEIDAINLQILVYKSNTNRTMDQELAYQSLLQTVEAKDKLYNYLLSRGEEINIASKERSGFVKIIEYAAIPVRPIKPNVPVYIAIGFILACIASIGVVFIKYSFKKTYMNPRAVEEEFGNLVIGTIPKLRIRDYAKPDPKKGYNLVFDYKPHAPFSEGIRTLKTNLGMYMREKNIKLISFTSPEEGDGKSLIASNIGLEMAYEGKKVLLVDVNMRKPRLNRLFLVKKSELGIIDVLLGNTNLNDVINKTPYKNLSFIPAGSLSRSSREIISHEKIKELFSKLKSLNYDAIIIDSPSIKYSESLIFSSHSQGVLLVVSVNKTNKESAVKTLEVLKHVKANIIGVVINFFK
jgi:succinoglycan biosynthesis transport protein ExoP